MFYKRFYDEPRAYLITEGTARLEFSCLFYHADPVIKDLENGIVVLTIGVAYANTEQAVNDAINRHQSEQPAA